MSKNPGGRRSTCSDGSDGGPHEHEAAAAAETAEAASALCLRRTHRHGQRQCQRVATDLAALGAAAHGAGGRRSGLRRRRWSLDGLGRGPLGLGVCDLALPLPATHAVREQPLAAAGELRDQVASGAVVGLGLQECGGRGVRGDSDIDNDSDSTRDHRACSTRTGPTDAAVGRCPREAAWRAKAPRATSVYERSLKTRSMEGPRCTAVASCEGRCTERSACRSSVFCGVFAR